MNPDAKKIIEAALQSADPVRNVTDALKRQHYNGKLTVVAAGKAACTMAKAACDVLGDQIGTGFALTKYGHAIDLPDVFAVREAGHPLPDENSVRGTEEILSVTDKLTADDTLLFLLSGGASALFESPEIPLDMLRKLTDELLKCGADITGINTVRKRLSKVKGGKFAKRCRCKIDCIILSDVLGDRTDVIASGPCCNDTSTTEDAEKILKKYPAVFAGFPEVRRLLRQEPVRDVTNARCLIAGNIELLCRGAEVCAGSLGYDTRIMTTSLTGEASEQGKQIARNAIAFAAKPHKPTVFLYGGETTVTVTGSGKGGRNQELSLAAAIELKGQSGITLFSLGSDGTDGPTDAAGGIADGDTYDAIRCAGSPEAFLRNNDAYHALKAAHALLLTGPTGTNVNDLTAVLIS